MKKMKESEALSHLPATFRDKYKTAKAGNMFSSRAIPKTCKVEPDSSCAQPKVAVGEHPCHTTLLGKLEVKGSVYNAWEVWGLRWGDVSAAATQSSYLLLPVPEKAESHILRETSNVRRGLMHPFYGKGQATPALSASPKIGAEEAHLVSMPAHRELPSRVWGFKC